MSVSHVELLVEEPSAEAAVAQILPQILGQTPFRVHRYDCKNQLLKRLPARLRGYSAWLPEDYRIVVLVDRDDDDCVRLKQELETIAQEAGLSTRSGSSGRQFQVVNRVVIEELESWFFGDWQAVHDAYPRVDANVPKQAKYRGCQIFCV